eukprot:1190173-Rhodomonas_salina.2
MYGLPGTRRTNIAYADIGLRARYAMSGTDIAYGVLPGGRGEREVQAGALCSYALAMQCPDEAEAVKQELVALPMLLRAR